MIIDFRNDRHLITDPLLARWKSVGATDILFTLHHPEHFTDDHLRSLSPLVDAIRAHGMRPGFYTGLLGLEKPQTVATCGLGKYLQVDANQTVIMYDKWRPGCCPNTDYVRNYRIPLLKKAISMLQLETIYFDFPWFLKNACFCDGCVRMFILHLASSGFANPECAFQDVLRDPFSEAYAEFLNFKAISIRSCIQETVFELKRASEKVRPVFNMGSTLSMIDNPKLGSWLTRLEGIGGDFLVEFTPYDKGVQTPIEMCGAAVRMIRSSTRNRGRAFFQLCFRYRASDNVIIHCTPEQVYDVYANVRRAGGIPYLSYQLSNPAAEVMPSPDTAYFDAIEKANIIATETSSPEVGVVYSHLSLHCASRQCLVKIEGQNTSVDQYLPAVWKAIKALESSDIEYGVTTLEDIHLGEYSMVLLPRTVVISDEDIKRVLGFAKSGGTVIATQDAGRLNGRGQGETRIINPLRESPNITFVQHDVNWLKLLNSILGKAQA